VHDAIEPPLNAYLCFPSEAEAIQSEAAPNIGKDGLDRRHPSAVNQLARNRIYLLPHLLREGLYLLIDRPGKVGELADFGNVRVLHALRALRAGDAISLGSSVPDGMFTV
jgi:hypothetical protein